MPIEKEKALSPLRELARQIEGLSFDEGQQDARYKYEVATDLNCLLANAYDGLIARAPNCVLVAEASWRIAQRVAEFEGIRRAK